MSNTPRSIRHNRRTAKQKDQMRKSNLLLLLAAVLVLGGIGTLVWMGWQTAVPPETTNSYGAPALAQQGGTVTEFTLGVLDGDPIALADYEGEVIIMNFWATWCPPCRAEMPGINNFYEAYKDEGLIVLAINEEESEEQVRPFIQLNNFTFPILLDSQGRVAQQYSTRSFPTTFIIDREGVIQHVQTGVISERELEEIIVPLLQ
jgi:peroxiredoxin